MKATTTAPRCCEQCGRRLAGASWILGPVCGRCVRRNHRKVAGREGAGGRKLR